jgi:CheY-like chemotaxis protein
MRIVLLSSIGDVRAAALASETSIHACLTKPARQSELYACLTRIMQSEAAALAAPNASEEIPATSSVRSSMRILIAENNVVNQQVAVGVLANLGFSADVVSNGQEAVAAVASGRYAAVLMDSQMPVMGGIAATRLIRRQEKAGAHIPIIALTADVVGDVRAECLAAGMDDYVSKPLDPAALAGTLRRCLASGPGADPLAGADASEMLGRLAELDRATPGLGQRIAALFVDDSAQRLAELAAALDRDDPVGVAAIAHAICGSAANVGAKRMKKAGQSLEDYGRSGTLDGARAAFTELSLAYEAARHALTDYGMKDAA